MTLRTKLRINHLHPILVLPANVRSLIHIELANVDVAFPSIILLNFVGVDIGVRSIWI